MHDHSGWIWVFYFLGQLVHLIFKAELSKQSNLNGIKTLRQYFQIKWSVELSRTFLATMCFPFIWDNPKLFNLDQYVLSAASMIGIAGILGWFSDSLFDKLLGLFPWFKKEIPS